MMRFVIMVWIGGAALFLFVFDLVRMAMRSARRPLATHSCGVLSFRRRKLR